MPKKTTSRRKGSADSKPAKEEGLDESSRMGISEGVVDPSKPLENQKHEVFARHIAKGKSAVDAYSEVYGTSGRTSEVNGSKLLRNAEILARVQYFQTKAAEGDVLSIREKREFYASVVRTPIGEIGAASPLCQSYKVSDSGTEYRVPDKLKATQLDSDLAGHIADKPSVNVNVGVNLTVLTEDRRKQLAEKKRNSVLRRVASVKPGVN